MPQVLRHRSLAFLALLALVLPGLWSVAHTIEHEHGLAELHGDHHGATSSIAAAECDRGASLHVEAAETVQHERCATCVLQSKSRASLDRRAAVAETAPSNDLLATTAADHRGSAVVRLHSSRAPPRA